MVPSREFYIISLRTTCAQRQTQADEAGLEKTKPPVPDVAADAVLAIIAGSDTTAAALSAFFYFILSDDESYTRLQKEIDSVYPPGTDATDSSMHDQLVYLDACL